MADADVKRTVNPANIMALLNHIQQEADAFMNLDVRDYVDFWWGRLARTLALGFWEIGCQRFLQGLLRKMSKENGRN
ncbi:hypothetical protein JB92DRAFT_3103034 [Gautieria morchelliformis]|nr:hypothetical protein JB92DRAFT_3103034 [Gautieria morchelliformis]